MGKFRKIGEARSGRVQSHAIGAYDSHAGGTRDAGQFGFHLPSFIGSRFFISGREKDGALDPFPRTFPHNGERAVMRDENNGKIDGTGDG